MTTLPLLINKGSSLKPLNVVHNHSLSIKLFCISVSDIIESLYQDPASLACTGPPGTPSPIRDALYATHEDPSTSSEIYADVDAVRGSPDGKTSSLPRSEQNV